MTSCPTPVGRRIPALRVSEQCAPETCGGPLTTSNSSALPLLLHIQVAALNLPCLQYFPNVELPQVLENVFGLVCGLSEQQLHYVVCRVSLCSTYSSHRKNLVSPTHVQKITFIPSGSYSVDSAFKVSIFTYAVRSLNMCCMQTAAHKYVFQYGERVRHVRSVRKGAASRTAGRATRRPRRSRTARPAASRTRSSLVSQRVPRTSVRRAERDALEGGAQTGRAAVRLALR